MIDRKSGARVTAEMLRRYDRPGPRYTSYPTAVEFNEGFDADPSAGAILIQTELAEVYVRRWELWPLSKAPPTAARWTDGKP